MTEPYAVVAGGAAMDVKARSDRSVVMRTSNPGVVTQTPGGVGRNIAEGIARLGSPVHLVAAIGDDPAGAALSMQASAAGVEIEQLITVPHPTGSYLALLNPDGELVAAVSDFAAADSLTVAQVRATWDVVAGAEIVVVDGNLPSDALGWVLRTAIASGVRVVLEPVSVAKAARLSHLLQLTDPVFAVTPNADELAALVEGPADDPQRMAAAAQQLHARGVEHVWVSLGAAGSLLSSHDGLTRLAAVPTTVVDVTGAGDALTAGFVHGLLCGQDVISAARLGHHAAAVTVASRHTVRPDLAAAVARSRTTGVAR